jgi:hypothetical protein
MLNFFRKNKVEPKIHILIRSPREMEMEAEQKAIQLELGFDASDTTQSWLRLHQILKSHEDRIKQLEAKL